MTDQIPFWRRKTLQEMTKAEWESLCDGCGKCCLIKLVDEDSGEVDYTDVVCHLLDTDTCRCTNYKKRNQLVPSCVILSVDTLEHLPWMPTTCAYRLLHEGKDLAWWHPLVSGDRNTVHAAAASVRHRVIPENLVEDEDLEDHIVDWPK
ncbi:MAG: YcgN family cysteine cluster protein [Alphaproteobacteria bacterium]|nr:YcgN family cysteine cluster protein [Alphaproteobacteria bacterium]MBU0798280.1 YcgN family cysteine cluster protein [Alphaproteobacteria bacterium]MBU0889142.1 YcgN family cysteine cluster protein [Alphaproteobacteria bacterium]MBU1812176.1 YcgN family cysteine cluster protein [Alphaproteobacteria bacterium]MBU2090956.1 YcgN family cysteine cluster protein [Alphaproteobacteria bacterium]